MTGIKQKTPDIDALPRGIQDALSIPSPFIQQGAQNMGNPALTGIAGQYVQPNPMGDMGAQGFANGGVVDPWAQLAPDAGKHALMGQNNAMVTPSAPSIPNYVNMPARLPQPQMTQLPAGMNRVLTQQPNPMQLGSPAGLGQEILGGIHSIARGISSGLPPAPKPAQNTIGMRASANVPAPKGAEQVYAMVNNLNATQAPGTPMTQAGLQQINQIQHFAEGGEVQPQMPIMQQGMPPGAIQGQMDPTMQQGQMTLEQQQAQIQNAEKIPAQTMISEVDRILKQQPEQAQRMGSMFMEYISSGAMSLDELNMLYQMAVTAVNNPQLYPQLRQQAIQAGMVSEEDLPEYYDQGLLFTFMLAAKAALNMVNAQGGGQPAPQPQQPEMQNFADGGYVQEQDKASDDYQKQYQNYQDRQDSISNGLDQYSRGAGAAWDSFGKRIHGVYVYSPDEFQSAADAARNMVYTDEQGNTRISNQRAFDNNIAAVQYANNYLSNPIDLSWYDPSSYLGYNFSGYDAGYKYGNVNRGLDNLSLGWTGADDMVRGYMAATESQNIPIITAGYTKGDSKKQAKHVPVVQNSWTNLSNAASNAGNAFADSYNNFLNTPVQTTGNARFAVQGLNAIDYHNDPVDRREVMQRQTAGIQGAPTQPVVPGSEAKDGGKVFGPGTGTSDSIPIRVSAGEYVIPAHVVRAKGTEFFDKMLANYSGDKPKGNK